MSLPGIAVRSTSEDKQKDCIDSGQAIMNLLDKDIKPSA